MLRLFGLFVVSSTVAACTRSDIRPDPPLHDVVAPRPEARMDRLGKPCDLDAGPFESIYEKCGKGNLVSQVFVAQPPAGWPWSPGVTVPSLTGSIVVAYEQDRVTYTFDCTKCRDPTPRGVTSVKLSVATDDQLGDLQRAIDLPSRPVHRDASELRAWQLKRLGARQF